MQDCCFDANLYGIGVLQFRCTDVPVDVVIRAYVIRRKGSEHFLVDQRVLPRYISEIVVEFIAHWIGEIDLLRVLLLDTEHHSTQKSAHCKA